MRSRATTRVSVSLPIGRLLLALAACATPLPAQLVALPGRPQIRPQLPPPSNYHPAHVLVRFAAGATPAQQQAAHTAAGALEVLSSSQNVPGLVVVRVLPGGVPAAMASYGQQPFVQYSEPDLVVRGLETPDDPMFGQLWGLLNVGQTVNGDPGVPGADIHAAQAWDQWTGDPGFRIAVVDTGIDYLHPALAANIWTNPGEIAGNGLDDEGNGWIDDVHGYDFQNDDGDPLDDHSHGTHVAGTIGATGDDALGVVGVNWRCSLVALKILGADNAGNLSDVIEALDYIVANDLRLSNHSYGASGFSQAVHDAFQASLAAGQLHVAAAGNDALDIDIDPFTPASLDLDCLITVAATTNDDALAYFSNWGAQAVELGAPGHRILSTIPGGGYAYYSGTSMAAPHVTGVAGLLMSRYPSEPISVICDLLVSHTRPIPALAGITASGGLVDAWAALEDCNGNGVLDRNEPSVDCDGQAAGSLGLGATDFALDELLLFGATESMSGGADLNGDGDLDDSVAHAWDPVSDAVTNLGLAVEQFTAFNDPPAITSVAVDQDLLVFSVREEDHGDLNGDGDAIDPVVHVHRAGTTTGLALASRFAFEAWDGRFVAFPVLEAEQGGADLDGDGDSSGAVLFVHDSQLGTTKNLLREPVGGAIGSGHWLVFKSPVGAAIHLVACEVTLGLQLDLGPALEWVLAAPYLLVSRPEAEALVDWNGDGDQLDHVLHLFTTSFTQLNLGLAAHSLLVDGSLAACVVPEAGQGGADLNGDGDAADGVLHVIDLASGGVTNLGLAASWHRVDGDTVAFSVSEQEQGADLDGDGVVEAGVGALHLYDRTSGQTTNLGFGGAPAGPEPLRDGWLALSVYEGGLQPPTDLDGDGDVLDGVLHVVEVATGAVTNLGLAGLATSLDGGVLACVVSEPELGADDLNGDGDALDWVAHLVELAAGATTNTGLACGDIGPNSFERTWPVVRDGQVVFAVREASQGGTDINGDGVQGLVLHTLSLAP